MKMLGFTVFPVISSRQKESVMADNDIDFFDLLMHINRDMRLEWFRYLNERAGPGGIVFAGDSIIQEFCVNEMLPQNTGVSIYNRGIGGDTVSGLLGHLRESIIDLQPSAVFVLIGTNDINTAGYDRTGCSEDFGDLMKEVRKALPDARLVLIGVLPVCPELDPQTTGRRTTEEIRSLNEILKITASENGWEFADPFAVMSDHKGVLKRRYTRDGLHLKPEGYAVLLDLLMPYLPFSL